MKNYIIPLFVLAAVGFSVQRSGKFNSGIISSFHMKNGGGSNPGTTGAPGEMNCTSCHSGNVLDGANENVLQVLNGNVQVSQYIPGTSYTVSLSMSSNPAKKGFQATALDALGQMAGTFTAGSSTSINGSLRKYANHKSTSNTNATSSWTWNWTAPSTDVGKITFYVASNGANGDNGFFGDKIYLSQHILTTQNGAATEEHLKQISKMSISHDAQNRKMNISFFSLKSGEMSINIIDVKGRSVFKTQIGTALIGENSHQISLPSDLSTGLYVVHLVVNNNAASAKLQILN